MKNRGVWVAFLVMCFLLVGLAGLFASYATIIPLEASILRAESAAPADRPGIIDAGRREAEAVAARTRLLLGVLTVIAAATGSGILLLASKDARSQTTH